MKQNDVLVSIIVITYNSAEFVLETLESVKTQTYDNIELIISDDGSKDDTISICRQWLEENGRRFVNVKLFTVEVNTGIPANCNRGVKASKGDWIKLIAGDDILLEECIDKNIKFSLEFDSKVILSNMYVFFEGTILRESLIRELGETASQQYQFLLRRPLSNAPALFLSKSIFTNFHYDESLPFEDYPFFLSITQQGYKIFYLNEFTVMYRVGHESAFGSANNPLFSNFYQKLILFDQKYRFPHLKANEIRKIKFDNKIMDFFNRYRLNKKTLMNRIFFRIVRAMNLYRYF